MIEQLLVGILLLAPLVALLPTTLAFQALLSAAACVCMSARSALLAAAALLSSNAALMLALWATQPLVGTPLASRSVDVAVLLPAGVATDLQTCGASVKVKPSRWLQRAPPRVSVRYSSARLDSQNAREQRAQRRTRQRQTGVDVRGAARDPRTAEGSNGKPVVAVRLEDSVSSDTRAMSGARARASASAVAPVVDTIVLRNDPILLRSVLLEALGSVVAAGLAAHPWWRASRDVMGRCAARVGPPFAT